MCHYTKCNKSKLSSNILSHVLWHPFLGLFLEMFTFPHALHISPPPPSKCTECSLLFLKCRTERSRDRTASRSSTTVKANHSAFLSAGHIHPKSHELRLGVLCLRQQSVSLTLQQVTDQATVFAFVTGGSVVISLTDTSLTAELKQYVCSYVYKKKKRKNNLRRNKTPTLEY